MEGDASELYLVAEFDTPDTAQRQTEIARPIHPAETRWDAEIGVIRFALGTGQAP